MDNLIPWILFLGIPAYGIVSMSWHRTRRQARVAAGVTVGEATSEEQSPITPHVVAFIVSTGVLLASLGLSGLLSWQILYGRGDLLFPVAFAMVFFGAVYFAFAAQRGVIRPVINGREVHPKTAERFTATMKSNQWMLLVAAAVPWGVLLAHFLLLGALGGLTDAPDGLVPGCVRYDTCDTVNHDHRRR